MLHRFTIARNSTIWLLAGATILCAADRPKRPTAKQIAFYNQQVKPILSAKCWDCHGVKKVEADLKLTSYKSALAGGESGPAVDLKAPSESLLLNVINYIDHEMPPSGKLPQQQIAILTRWVKMGAPYAPGQVDPELPSESNPSPQVTAEAKNWWAYRKLTRPAVPQVKNTAWVTNPIDAFILAGLETAKLQPAEPAEKVALVRRAYYDLTGLPPTPSQLDAFLADSSGDAYEKVIDHLLNSPHYGEKWGRHWLDLVRYAETNGYERDGEKPFAWRYRDYVIRSFNDDKPYDRFVLEQLAGDELPDRDFESIIATAYFRLGLWDDEPVDRLQAFYDGLDDVVSTTGQLFLGMTIGCCRCHNHKIDPMPQQDYYRFLAFFNNISQAGGRAYTLNTLVPIVPEKRWRAHQQKVEELAKQTEQIQATIKQFEKKIVATFSNAEKEDAADRNTRRLLIKQKQKSALSEDDLKSYLSATEKLARLRNQKLPPLPQALSIKEAGRTAQETYVLKRGNAHVHGEKVEPGFPTVLDFADPQIPQPSKDLDSSGRRLVLARWITSRENPLTARVMANRLWQFHLGRGIATSTSDFGNAGVLPTHPQLLDWLAVELMDRNWRLKSMHKLIMMSSTYRMSSTLSALALEKDPTNRLFWRFDMRRLTAEEIRDSVLAINGTLNMKMFGPSIYPPLPQAVLDTASRPEAAWGKSSPKESARRSIYIKVKRSLRHPMLSNFDAPDTDSSCAVRFATTVPTQALGMLNSQFTNRQAVLLAERLQREFPNDPAGQIRRAIRLTTGRLPKPGEVARDVQFIKELRRDEKLSAVKALENYCLMMLNLNEFVYLE